MGAIASFFKWLIDCFVKLGSVLVSLPAQVVAIFATLKVSYTQFTSFLSSTFNQSSLFAQHLSAINDFSQNVNVHLSTSNVLGTLSYMGSLDVAFNLLCTVFGIFVTIWSTFILVVVGSLLYTFLAVLIIRVSLWFIKIVFSATCMSGI